MSEEQSESGGEFEREPVPDSELLGSGKFWGMYAGEHCAGTEFMIGPLFLGAGASLGDVVFGLLIGNLLAVLTWRYLVVPIAMAKRLTLYYQLERIAGGDLVKLYNVVNGVLFCFLAGAMITVSATAVGVPLNVTFDVPDDVFALSTPSFTALVALVGVVITIVAAAGYQMVARVANIAAPWMIIVFAASGIVSLGRMDVNTYDKIVDGSYWNDGITFVKEEIAEKSRQLIAQGEAIVTHGEAWGADEGEGGENSGAAEAVVKLGENTITEGENTKPPVFTLTHIIIFAWLCNGAMHFGMADLSIFRFARHKSSGWAPAIGMFLGHYMAWIAAGLLLAAQIHLSQDTSADPGKLAWGALGWTGILCVIIAGWTTANPTIYRAGLAFQGVLPTCSRVQMTLLAGLVATVAGAFPNLSAKLLDFVGTYGTVLGPMGAVIFVDYYLMKQFGLRSEYAAETGRPNAAVLIAWLLPVVVGLYLIFWQGVFAAYLVIPAWITCGVLYLILSKATQEPAQGDAA